MNYLKRRLLINDDLFGLKSIQKTCYITGVPANRCTTHEWLLRRSSGLPKRNQDKIMALQNMVFVEAGLHDTGLWAGQELYIAARKIQLHGFDEINAWIESLEMRTAPTLDEWINRRISMAITSYERDGDIFDREPKHPSAFLYTKWICQLRLCISNGARQEVFDAIRNGNI